MLFTVAFIISFIFLNKQLMKFLFTGLIGLWSACIAYAQLQSPEEFLGYPIGAEFSRHADVVRYFEHVAAQSDLVTYQEYGRTNERRPLTYAVVSTAENIANLEDIRRNNLAQAGIINSPAPDLKKAIVWLSYNVHGNEASSTEASMVTLYELVTSHQEWLENTIVIIDPCVNPDGRDRYANWYNQVASKPYDPLQAAAEHHEPWPGGRPNHYLFDLNRDWAWATQVETIQRLKVYNQWMPHVHVDFHEQGINEPYYFAPAAEPFHEVITPFQREFQTEIGLNNARYFDDKGWLYFTRERFDLLYPSYGDTYPTYMGAIGMTYEQAGHGRAGLGIMNDEGFELTLVDRVDHHKTTGLSTVEVASKNAERLNTSFKKYFQNDELEVKSYVLKGHVDQFKALAELLDKHEITYGFTGKGKTTGIGYEGTNNKTTLNYDRAMVVSTNQPKGKMVQVLFEPDAQLSTPLTYDITAWNLPKAYGLEAVGSTTLVTADSSNPFIKKEPVYSENATGYIAKWNSMQDARFLAALLKNDINVRFTEKPFINNGKSYERGTLIITKSDNRTHPDYGRRVQEIATQYNRDLDVATTSFATTGPDFGSPDIKLIHAPRVALLKGERTSSLSYGATWYYFEQSLNYPVTSIDTEYLSSVNLQQFDVLIMPSGYYSGLLNDDMLDKIKDFVRGGGKVIAIDNAVSSFANKEGFSLKTNAVVEDKEKDADDKDSRLTPYASREEAAIPNLITGSIFKTQIDQTHPLAFGYKDIYYSLKLGSDSYSYLDNGYNVGWIPDEVENVSGFAGDMAKSKLKNSMIFGEERQGRGSIIYMVDDPLFRAFWENGKLFFANAVFLVNNNKPEL